MSEIEHEYTDVPVCPHCGYGDDGWLHSSVDSYGTDGKTEIEQCGKCGKEYGCTVSIEYSFSSEQMEGENENR